MSAPWETEPNEARFADEATGYPIALKRHPTSLHWCAYVGVPDDHAWHGREYSEVVKAPLAIDIDEITVADIGIMNVFCASGRVNREERMYPIDVLVRCHGGLTFSGTAYWEDDRSTWWFGFDCAHAGDIAPGHLQYGGGVDGDVYRDLEYVKQAATKAAGCLGKARGDLS